jgi:ribosomal protein S27E/predicted RND superfamily exporter protein
MSDKFIVLKCPQCGASLDIYEDMEHFSCGYCGTTIVIQRRGGTVLLKIVAEAIKNVQIGTDKTAAELAIVRLQGELNELTQKQTDLNRQTKELFGKRKRLIEEKDNNAANACVTLIVGFASLIIAVALIYTYGGGEIVQGGFILLFICTLLLFIAFIILLNWRKHFKSGLKHNDAVRLDIEREVEEIKSRIEETSLRIQKNKRIVDG